MSSLKKYLSLVKFSHTIFAMPFALIGFFLAFFKKGIQSQQMNLNQTIGWGWDITNFVFWKLLEFEWADSDEADPYF